MKPQRVREFGGRMAGKVRPASRLPRWWLKSFLGLRRRAGGVLLVLPWLLPPGASGAQEPSPPLTLAEAVERALVLHPAVGRARAAQEGAEAVLTLSRSALLPMVSGQGGVNRFQEPMVVAPLHGFDPRRPPAFHRTLVQGALSLSYLLFDGGGRQGRLQESRAGLDGARENVRKEAMDAAVETASAYLEVLALTEVREAALRHVEALEAEETRVAAFFQEGKAAQVELLRAGAALAAARAEEVQTAAELELAWQRLARRTGLDVDGLRKRGLAPFPWPGPPLPPLESLLEHAEAGSPEVALARKEVEAARASLEAVRGVWFPQVEAVAQLQNFGTWDGGHTQEWQMGLRLSYPLFTGGGRGAEVARARSRLLQGEEALRLARWRLEEGVETVRAQAEAARARREAMERAVEQAEEVARIEALALAEGVGVQSDLLRAYAELFRARGRLAEARLAELLARVQLARWMGEPVETWLTQGKGDGP